MKWAWIMEVKLMSRAEIKKALAKMVKHDAPHALMHAVLNPIN